MVVRFLLYWFQTQEFVVKWSHHISGTFTVRNGVRQGGILSPILFNVFIDGLSNILNRSGIGCHINDVSVNHLQYADDSVILAPSPSGLQKLLNICESYAKDYDMIYNAKKTVCMCIKSKGSRSMTVPEVILDGNRLKWLTEHKYLGIYISNTFADDCDIRRQTKSVYAKGNILIRKFNNCTQEVKAQLFQSYCTNMYCGSLWYNHKVSSFKAIMVAYNKVFKYLMNVKGACSMSQLFIDNNVDHFKVLFRKCTIGTLTRLFKSQNILVTSIINSMYFMFNSELYLHWQTTLY